MDFQTGYNTRTYRSKVDASGRIALPADVRLRQHIHTGDQLVIIESKDGLHVRTQEQAIRDAQALFARLAPPDILLSQKLIKERREDAKHE